VTASFGVAPLEAGDDADSMFHRTDLVLYASKQDERDRLAARVSSDRPDGAAGAEDPWF